MKILGFEHVTFNFNDGRSVSGNYLYLHDDKANPDKVTGMRTERVFLSDSKAEICRFSPKVGMDVKVLYNRYGKVDEVQASRA